MLSGRRADWRRRGRRHRWRGGGGCRRIVASAGQKMVSVVVGRMPFARGSRDRNPAAGGWRSNRARLGANRHARYPLAPARLPADRRLVLLSAGLPRVRNNSVKQRRSLPVALVKTPRTFLLQQTPGNRVAP